MILKNYGTEINWSSDALNVLSDCYIGLGIQVAIVLPVTSHIVS